MGSAENVSWEERQRAKRPELILKPNFTPYVTTGVILALVVGVPAISIRKGLWWKSFHSLMSGTLTVGLLALGILCVIIGILEIRNERVYFFREEFVYVGGLKRHVERVRYDQVKGTSCDSGWTRGEMHITVKTADGRKIKISNTIFNHHRFRKELKKRVDRLYAQEEGYYVTR